MCMFYCGPDGSSTDTPRPNNYIDYGSGCQGTSTEIAASYFLLAGSVIRITKLLESHCPVSWSFMRYGYLAIGYDGLAIIIR